MIPLSVGQRVRVHSLRLLLARTFTGTITATPTDDRPGYRVALDAQFGGDTISARRIELVALPTPLAEVVTTDNWRGYYAFRPTL